MRASWGGPSWDNATCAHDSVGTQEDEESGTHGEERLQTRGGSSHAFPFPGEHRKAMTAYVTPHDTTTQENAKGSFPRKAG